MTRSLGAALLLIGGGVAAPAVAQEGASAPDGVAGRFARMDVDGDGRVDAAEWERAIATRPPARPDAPPPGAAAPRAASPGAALPLPAARRLELLRDLFTRIDADGDGGLSLVEVRAFGRAVGAEPPAR